MKAGDSRAEKQVISKDEMNLIEVALGPITAGNARAFEVRNEVYDRFLKRWVTRATLITGSQLFGLPRPIDDQVLVGMQALTYESGYTSRRVNFSRYHLCHILGWRPDGRSYRRLEESFDRIAGTTLKFKDAWYDKGDQQWKSKTFHLIEEVDLCSRDQLDRARITSGQAAQQLCSFLWNITIWSSLQNGFVKTLDLQMYRTIAQGRRREVPLRLFRLLDKRFHRGSQVKFDLEQLCVNKLGLSPNYGPSQMLRIIARAADWLTECGYLRGFQAVRGTAGRRQRFTNGRNRQVIFYKLTKGRRQSSKSTTRQSLSAPSQQSTPVEPDRLKLWIARQCEELLCRWEDQALREQFGSVLERRLIESERSSGQKILGSGPIRQEYVRKYAIQTSRQ